MFCAVIGREEIYKDIEEPVPAFKREIIFEYLYVADDFESYEDLKGQQADKPFYVPDKEELLKFADDQYGLSLLRPTREYQALRAFVEKVLKLKDIDGVLGEIYDTAVMDGGVPEFVEDTLCRVGRMRDFPSEAAKDQFFRLCGAMCGNVRMHAHRGHTPREIPLLCGDE